MAMRSFSDVVAALLREDGQKDRRSDGRHQSIDPDNPMVRAITEWEELNKAFFGRSRKAAPQDDSGKVRRRMRRHADELIASAQYDFDAIFNRQREKYVREMKEVHSWLASKLAELPERMAYLYFTADIDEAADFRQTRIKSELSRALADLQASTGQRFDRTVERLASAIGHDAETLHLAILDIEQELAKLNQYLVPRAEVDRTTIFGRYEMGAATIRSEQGVALQVEIQRSERRLRQFEEQMHRALSELEFDKDRPPAADDPSGPDSGQSGRIILPRPIPFKLLAEDYAEEAVALYRLKDDSVKTRSRLGGLPNLPAGWQWPRDRAGNRLHFAAQIDLAEMAWLPPTMEITGTLLFFVLLDDELNCEGSVAVVYDQGSTGDVAAIPDDLGPVAGVQLRGLAAETITDRRLLASYAIKSAMIASIPEPSAFADNAYRTTRYVDYCRGYRPFRTKQLVDATGQAPVSGLYHHQLFGYVASVQAPLPANSQMLTLLQIVSDDEFGISIGDGGAIDFQISPKALAHQQWNEVRAVYAGG